MSKSREQSRRVGVSWLFIVCSGPIIALVLVAACLGIQNDALKTKYKSDLIEANSRIDQANKMILERDRIIDQLSMVSLGDVSVTISPNNQIAHESTWEVSDVH